MNGTLNDDTEFFVLYNYQNPQMHNRHGSRQREQRENDETPRKKNKVDETYFSIRDVEFIGESSELCELVTCPICRFVMSKAYALKNCQHTFCQECITRHHDQHDGDVARCPLCRERFQKSDMMVSIIHEDLLGRLKVKCVGNMCSWTGMYSCMSNHIKTECTRVWMCDCGEVVDQENKREHVNACEMVRVRCKCEKMMPQCKMTEHIENECPEHKCWCVYKTYGCNWREKRKDLLSHTQNCTIMSLLLQIDDLKSKLSSINMDKRAYRNDQQNNTSEHTVSNETLINMVTLSDPWNTCGMTEKTMNIFHSYLDVGADITYGEYGKDDISILRMKSDSMYEFKTKVLNGSCVVQIVKEKRMAVVTLNGKHNRFFIMNTQDMHTRSTRKNNSTLIIMCGPCINYDNPSPILYSYRRYAKYADDKEYPFVIQLVDCYITEIAFAIKDADVMNKLRDDLNTFVFSETHPIAEGNTNI